MSPEFAIAIPASSANLGPGFDAAALALDLYLRVTAQPAAAFSIFATGRDPRVCEQLESNLILETYRSLAGAKAPALALQIDNQIPIGKGCGSSAAARLAGAALAARFGGGRRSAQHVFESAARLEGHPDNAAAAWWGGVVVAGVANSGSTAPWAQLPLPRAWPLLLAVPSLPLATEKARAVLPAAYSRADTVANVQSAMLLAGAVASGRGDLLAAATRDLLHQPYRAALCPLFPALQPLVGQHGILAATLSGAGSSVLLWLDGENHAAQPAIRRVIAAAGLEAELIHAAIVARGPGLDWNP